MYKTKNGENVPSLEMDELVSFQGFYKTAPIKQLKKQVNL